MKHAMAQKKKPVTKKNPKVNFAAVYDRIKTRCIAATKGHSPIKRGAFDPLAIAITEALQGHQFGTLKEAVDYAEEIFEELFEETPVEWALAMASMDAIHDAAIHGKTMHFDSKLYVDALEGSGDGEVALTAPRINTDLPYLVAAGTQLAIKIDH